MHGHLPFFVSRLGVIMRHATHLYHSAARMLEIGLYSLQIGRPGRHQQAPTHFKRLLQDRKFFPRAEPLLIHYHIFKNAGTSFQSALEQVFGVHVHSYDSANSGGLLSADDLVRYATMAPEAKAIFSHQAVLPPPRVRGRSIISSILIRDPMARIRSIYAFERRQNRVTPGALKAKELDLKGYVEWRLSNSPAMVCNYQVSFCSRGKDTPQNKEPTEDHLQQAIQNLDQIDIVGTVERYHEWLALAQSILAKSFPNISLALVRRNVTEERADRSHEAILDDLRKELGLKLADRLLACNYLDMCLHQVADALLTRRLAEACLSIALAQAYGQAAKNLPLPGNPLS
jgi:hypothetical protein